MGPGGMAGRPRRIAVMTDPELRREIERGGADGEAAADELAARREARPRIRGIDPQARLSQHHGAA